MFALGLIVGPLIGLLIGVSQSGTRPLDPRVRLALVVLLIGFVALVRFFSIELKIALIGGTALGFLLANTPFTPPQGEEP